jgi:hypothetical protein
MHSRSRQQVPIGRGVQIGSDIWGPVYRRTVQTTLKASYTGHHRRGLIELVKVLEFRSNNTAHRPVLDAVELVARHADDRRTTIRLARTFPNTAAYAVTGHHWVYRPAGGSQRRAVRSVYEICTFQALHDQLRCKEIWVVGADRYRNPDEDLPAAGPLAGGMWGLCRWWL